MQSNQFKIVYSNWINVSNELIPLANGLHPAVVKWIEEKVKNDANLTFKGAYSRCNEIEDHF